MLRGRWAQNICTKVTFIRNMTLCCNSSCRNNAGESGIFHCYPSSCGLLHQGIIRVVKAAFLFSFKCRDLYTKLHTTLALALRYIYIVFTVSDVQQSFFHVSARSRRDQFFRAASSHEHPPPSVKQVKHIKNGNKKMKYGWKERKITQTA